MSVTTNFAAFMTPSRSFVKRVAVAPNFTPRLAASSDVKTAEVAAVADGTYDFKISAPDEGVLCTIKDVAVKGTELTFTAEQGKACK